MIDFYKKNKVLCFAFTFLVIVLIVVLLIPTKKNDNPIPSKNEIIFALFGESNLTINVGDKYIDPGFYAINEDKINETDKVKVSGQVNTNKPGIYVITYIYDSKVLKRTIEVLETTVVDNSSLILNGSDEITIDLGTPYSEPGFEARDINGDSLNDKVVVTGTVNTFEEGTYKLTYSVINSEGKEYTKTRTIKVVNNNLTINLEVTNTALTNKDVSVSVYVKGNEFAYLTYPNQTVTRNIVSTYTISENGTYTFKVFNQNGKEFTKTITISNIDKTAPTGSCSAILNFSSTEIKVNAYDNNGIYKYDYLDNQTIINSNNNTSFIYNKKTSKNIYVKVYDLAGNTKLLTCNVTDKSYYPAILPNQSENVIYKGETNTLKVYVTKESSYYITRVWAKDPYNQLNKFDSPEYGSKLYRPSSLLSKANSKYNLTDKLLIGFNASGFYLKDTYDASSVSKYAKYNKTSVGTLVITNGKVIRNVYNKAYKTWFIMGVDKNNKMRIFKDSKASTTEEINKKKAWSEEVINSGIRNTYTFAAPIIMDGKKTNITTSMPDTSNNTPKNLQIFCQVNDNNFILVTAVNTKRNTIINRLLQLNCQTATNLDGGGSIALLYKDKNSNTIKKIVGDGRSLPEVGYFSE